MAHQEYDDEGGLGKLFVGLVAGIIIAGLIFGIYFYIGNQWQEDIDQSYLEGQQQGALFAVQDILRVTSQCQPYPIQVSEEQTITLIAQECLQNG